MIRWKCVVVVLVLLASTLLHAQRASLHGTVRDSHGEPVAGAFVQLQPPDAGAAQTVHTDSQGKFSFVALAQGVYSLRAEMTGYRDTEVPSLFFTANEAKTVDLTLAPASSTASLAASSPKPEFFDHPQFTVAGVTDTTTLGGHGSDTIVRARETLAKDTASLAKVSAVPADPSEPEISLRREVEKDPGSFDANHRLGEALLAEGKARDAISYLDRAAALKPADDENCYDLALAYERIGNYERARDISQSLIARSDKAEFHHLLADAHENLGNSLQAVRDYQRAAELDPTETYFFDWGSELLLHHAPEPAIEVFNEGNRRFPRSVRLLVGVGAAEFARGSYDQAVQKIRDASDLNPKDPIPYLFLGKMQSAESAPSEKVAETLRRFVTLQPENAEANYYYAVSLWKLRKASQDVAGLDEVDALLQTAIRLDPKFAAAHLQMGILHADKRDYPRAISEYQQAITADPKMEEAHYRMAQACRQMGDSAKAEAEFKAYRQIAQESAESAERERHEIRQFVYTLRDQPPAQTP